MNTEKLKKATGHYVVGLLATMWNAGWNSMAGIFAVDGAAISGVSDKVHVLSAHEMAAAFIGGALIHGVLWIKGHPIPETIDTNPPMPPPSL